MQKKLTKSNDKKIAGVCGGIAEYLNIDPTIIRVIWLLMFFGLGTGVLAYIVAAIVMPDPPKTDAKQESKTKAVNVDAETIEVEID